MHKFPAVAGTISDSAWAIRLLKGRVRVFTSQGKYAGIRFVTEDFHILEHAR